MVIRQYYTEYWILGGGIPVGKAVGYQYSQLPSFNQPTDGSECIQILFTNTTMIQYVLEKEIIGSKNKKI